MVVFSRAVVSDGFDRPEVPARCSRRLLLLSGDVTLTADVAFPADGGAIPLKKAVLIVRQSLDPASPYADLCRTGQGEADRFSAGDHRPA